MCKHDLGKPHGPHKTKAVNVEDQPEPFSCSEYLQINDPRYSLVPDTCCVLCDIAECQCLISFVRVLENNKQGKCLALAREQGLLQQQVTDTTTHLVELIRHGIVVGWDWGQELGAGKREALLKLLQVAENKHREKRTCTKTCELLKTERKTIPAPRFKRTPLTCTVTPQSFTKRGWAQAFTAKVQNSTPSSFFFC